MRFQPRTYAVDENSILKDEQSQQVWTPLFWHDCSFTPEVFAGVMMNLIRNPNLNSNHLFRADILLDTPFIGDLGYEASATPIILKMDSFDLKSIIVRRLIPRNALVDRPLDQTCLLYLAADDTETKSLVIYLPHVGSASEMPFYHPAVKGMAFLHTFGNKTQATVSIHYLFFESQPQNPALVRTAHHLLSTLHKHGQGVASGYVKRVHHDNILPQARVQDTYARLKAKYAKSIITQWVEVTDPAKHVFEDLGIVAFLIELWADMYPDPSSFPGFVDIGCGNGLIVYILLEENYPGWGFDARKRKSWDIYSQKAQANLKELVLIPEILRSSGSEEIIEDLAMPAMSEDEREYTNPRIQSGNFPKGTFIISNHADELTPWTPILATLSESPFIMIPCCSHNLTGARFRAPPSKEAGASNSAYASLVSWASKLAADCGWKVEKEMLRIPSTRNTALLGRFRRSDYAEIDIERLVERYGGATGWEENAMKLVKGGPRGH